MDVEETAPNSNFNEIRFIVCSNQLDSLSNASLNLPPDICDSYWKTNTENQKMITPSDTMLNSCCPLLIGPCCSPLRRKEYLYLFKSFVFWLIISQIVMFVILERNNFTPLNINFKVEQSILIKYGGIKYNKLKDEKEYWRILTGMFLHESFSHLISNVLIEVLFLLSREKSWNILRFLILFIIPTIPGDFLIISKNKEHVSIGAGCGTFSAAGAFITLYILSFQNMIWRHRIGMLFYILFLILLLIVSITQTIDDSYGLVLSFLFGLFLGVICFSEKTKELKNRFIYIGISSVVCLGLFFIPIIFFFKPL